MSRYTGTWIEIANYPQRFQRGCTGSTATYTLRDDGEIGVSLTGGLIQADGTRAPLAEASQVASLKRAGRVIL